MTNVFVAILMAFGGTALLAAAVTLLNKAARRIQLAWTRRYSK